eukprot:422038-Hanusia_phi.AAC.1
MRRKASHELIITFPSNQIFCALEVPTKVQKLDHGNSKDATSKYCKAHPSLLQLRYTSSGSKWRLKGASSGHSAC